MTNDCCEDVYVEDICGGISDLLGSLILSAEESTSRENPEGVATVLTARRPYTSSHYTVKTPRCMCTKKNHYEKVFTKVLSARGM